MRFIFCLVVPLLFSTLSADAQTAEPVNKDACTSFKVTVTTIPSEKPNNYEVRFTTEGGKAPYRYIFYDLTGRLVSEAFGAGRYDNLKSGDYQCLAVDSGHCRQPLTIHLP